MNVKLIPSTRKNAYIIKNMYPLYLYDLSPCFDKPPNRHGIHEPTDIRTLAKQADVQNIWWQKPRILFPFLIRVDGAPAGFAFVALGPPHVSKTADFSIVEFFVLRVFRKKGVARRAVAQLLRRFPGRCEGHVLRKNYSAIAFWRKVLRGQKGLKFEKEFHLPNAPQCVKFTFDNSRH